MEQKLTELIYNYTYFGGLKNKSAARSLRNINGALVMSSGLEQHP